jgi:hypothetical protein
MNNEGDASGTSYHDPGCGPFCLPILDTAAFRKGARIVLPNLLGKTSLTVRGMNSSGRAQGI